MRRLRVAIVVLAALALAATPSNGPIALDWHPGGRFYVLQKNGGVSVVDPAAKKQVAAIPALFGMVPAEIFSARLQDREYVFVSGFWGRSGTVWQYTADGKPYARFETPEQAASFDVDAARHLLYVASPVTNVVYSIDLEQHGSTARRVAYLRDAEAIGPVVFDPGRNRVMVGDTGNGALYDVDVTNGTYQKIASDLGRPISLAIGPAFRSLYVADAVSGRVHIFRVDKGALRRADVIPTGLRGLSAVTSGPDDTLFVADGSAVYQVSLKTKKLTLFRY